jgi:hypothetical protein
LNQRRRAKFCSLLDRSIDRSIELDFSGAKLINEGEANHLVVRFGEHFF